MGTRARSPVEPRRVPQSHAGRGAAAAYSLKVTSQPRPGQARAALRTAPGDAAPPLGLSLRKYPVTALKELPAPRWRTAH